MAEKRALKEKSVKPKKLKVATKNSNQDTTKAIKSKKISETSEPKGTSLKEKSNVKSKKINKTATFKNKNTKNNSKTSKEEKPEDWNVFKKEKKELKLKRKQVKCNYDTVVKAKKLGELLRKKKLKDGIDERNKLVNELHNLLKKEEHYSKFVLAHDTARIVQWLLKYSSPLVRQEIFKELIKSIPNMMQSKYGIFCVKRLLKYGTSENRSDIINKFYGNAVKFASNSLSAACLETAYTTWATPQQKLHLAQEFYGDMYKNSKDDNIKCLNDAFKTSPNMKTAILGATKANLTKILNKNLLDSALFQTVCYQYLLECTSENKSELISQLASHVVVLSNSKDGSRVAMQCIWNGTNKVKKVLMKALKEHLVDLSKHEYGHCTIITLLDSTDDTVLLNKTIISEILKNAKLLSENEWGRKVLLWLVVPDNSTYFHPQFVKELNAGRETSTCKKPLDVRRSEILNFSSPTLLNLVTMEPEFWLSNSKLGYEMLAIVKSAVGPELEYTFESLVKVITDLDWKITEDGKEVLGIEHSGMHLVLKKIAQQDKINTEKGLPTFGSSLSKSISNNVIESWIQLNRGCFLLVLVLENNSTVVQNELKERIVIFKEKISKLKTKGASILLKKIM